MSRFLRVLIFLAFLWLLSYGIANIFFGEQSFENADGEIAVIPVQGMITLNGGSSLLSSSTSAVSIVEKIETASANDNVKGIVLDINSPGGTVMGSKRIADSLKEVEKPVVAVISEYGTSGAYWVASQSDVIVADELSIVGSIGVIGSYLEFGGLFDDYNVTYQRLVTGEFKDISSPYKELTSEEEDLILERLQGIHDFFVADVAAGRGIAVSEIDAVADGLFYLGMDSVSLGLVDELGDRDDAIALVEEMAGITDGSVEEYVEEKSFFDTLQEYTSSSFFSMGQGIGSVLVSDEPNGLAIEV